MAYMLLTGATGLLGGYLLRDALRQELPVAVIVRRSASISARRRINAVLAPFETERALPRPVVLEGDLSQPGLGLADEDRSWLAANCRSVLHSAASISFYRDDRSGEPYRTNVDGTRNLLEVCRTVGIDEFHHVSTAYVCGERSGRILEGDLEVGQRHGNDYELSKVAAEKMVQAAGFRQPPTFYRPSIIIGDSETGYTTTFHGFYTPIQVAWWLAKAGVLQQGADNWFLSQLGLTGKERKNIVPVDWVSRVTMHLVTSPAAHGRTFHLTCDNPPSAADLDEAIGEVLKPQSSGVGFRSDSSCPADALDAADFRKHMDVYRAYFRDHPEFDTTNLCKFAPHLPCPRVDRAMLARTGKYALDRNFGWPRIQPPKEPLDLPRSIGFQPVHEETAPPPLCTFEVTGVGGGAWSFPLNTGGVTSPARLGRAANPVATIRLRCDTLSELVAKRFSVDEALLAGRVLIAASPESTESAVALLKTIISQLQAGSPLATSTSAEAGRKAAPLVHAR